MKCCVSTDVGTWTNILTFEPDPDYNPDAGTGLLSPISYKRCYAEFYYVGKIPRTRIGGSALQRGMVLKWFYSLSRRITFVGGTCALPSALIVVNPLDAISNYNATSNKLVHWPLMGGLLHLVQWGGAWAGWGPAQSPPHCTKCNSPPINGQCTNHCIAI